MLNKKNMLLLSLLAVMAIGMICTFATCASFGRIPRGERLERVKHSPHYWDDKFQNITPSIRQNTPGRSRPRIFGLLSFVLRDKTGLCPDTPLPTVKTDLHQLDRDEDILIWFGHSSCFIQTDRKRILIDPVLVKAAPFLSAFNKPFKGTDRYKPKDIPAIDYLIITHDHWDHLDYDTLKHLKNRTGKIICALGVGEHFEYWGFDKDRIIELDWNEGVVLENGFTLHCLPARHFSGRGLFSRDKTLWASWMLQTPSRNIYISGDGGYDRHFAEIGKQFEEIDLAIMENGQYRMAGQNRHLIPEDLVKAVRELHPKKLITVHNSKYTLSNHLWQEPLAAISQADAKESLNLLTPMIGEPVYLNDTDQGFHKWWEDSK
jgi:L-ascorbate metabolism protein UlaG (beta-lactamase superfamily)